jgi:hypothetical protein
MVIFNSYVKLPEGILFLSSRRFQECISFLISVALPPEAPDLACGATPGSSRPRLIGLAALKQHTCAAEAWRPCKETAKHRIQPSKQGDLYCQEYCHVKKQIDLTREKIDKV